MQIIKSYYNHCIMNDKLEQTQAVHISEQASLLKKSHFEVFFTSYIKKITYHGMQLILLGLESNNRSFCDFQGP